MNTALPSQARSQLLSSQTARIASEVRTTLKVFSLVLVGVGALLLASEAMAHDALPTAAKPNGWSYPFACCSGVDCRAVSSKLISERPEGYQISSTGEMVGYTDARVKNSPDGDFHWCSVQGKDDSRTICLFVPPRAF